MQEIKGLSETDVIKHAVTSVDTAALAARVLTNSLLESPYATIEASVNVAAMEESELKLK